MAWSQVGTPTSANGTTSLSLTNPSGLADGDILVAHIFTGPDTVTPTITGFTQQVSFNLAADNVRLTVLTKVASGEGASQTVGGIGSSTGTFGALQAWRGGNTSSVVDAVGAGTTGQGQTVVAAASISPAASTDLLLFLALWSDTNAATAPGGMTENLDASDGAGLRLYSAYEVLTTSGATGSRSATKSGTAIDYLAVLLALTLAPQVTVTSVAPANVLHAQTSVVVTGTVFGASQGAGSVIIAPTNNVADVNAVTQTVTAWADTEITITTNQGALAYGPAFLFVLNDAGASNGTGYPVFFNGRFLPCTV